MKQKESTSSCELDDCVVSCDRLKSDSESTCSTIITELKIENFIMNSFYIKIIQAIFEMFKKKVAHNLKNFCILETKCNFTTNSFSLSSSTDGNEEI